MNSYALKVEKPTEIEVKLTPLEVDQCLAIRTKGAATLLHTRSAADLQRKLALALCDEVRARAIRKLPGEVSALLPANPVDQLQSLPDQERFGADADPQLTVAMGNGRVLIELGDVHPLSLSVDAAIKLQRSLGIALSRWLEQGFANERYSVLPPK